VGGAHAEDQPDDGGQRLLVGRMALVGLVEKISAQLRVAQLPAGGDQSHQDASEPRPEVVHASGIVLHQQLIQGGHRILRRFPFSAPVAMLAREFRTSFMVQQKQANNGVERVPANGRR